MSQFNFIEIIKKKKKEWGLYPVDSFVRVNGRKTKYFKSAFCANPKTKEGSLNSQLKVLMNIVFYNHVWFQITN